MPPQKQTHTHKSQIATVFGWSWIISITTLILGSQPKKTFWFQHLVDHCGLVNTKVQEVGQLHFQLQEALAKVVGPSVFPFLVGQWWCRKKPNGDVMCGVKGAIEGTRSGYKALLTLDCFSMMQPYRVTTEGFIFFCSIFLSKVVCWHLKMVLFLRQLQKLNSFSSRRKMHDRSSEQRPSSLRISPTRRWWF